MEYVSPTLILKHCKDKSSAGGYSESALKYLARLYVNYVMPSDAMLSMAPDWPVTVLFSGYTPFKKYLEAYERVLKSRLVGDRWEESACELVRLYSAQSVCNITPFWKGVFDDPIDRLSEIESLLQRLECSKSPLVSDLGAFRRDLAMSNPDYRFCDAPDYFYSILPDLIDDPNEPTRTVGANWGYKHELDFSGDVSVLFERAMSYKMRRPDYTFALLRYIYKGYGTRTGFKDGVREQVVDELFGFYKRFGAVNESLEWDFMHRDHYVSEAILLEALWPMRTADLMYMAFMETTTSLREDGGADMDEYWQIVEQKAYAGSVKACLWLHDYVMPLCGNGTECGCMADFWWRLRERHQRQTYFEDPMVNHEYDGWTDSDWAAYYDL